MRRHRGSRRPRLTGALIALLLVVPATPALAYLKFGFDVGGRAMTLSWRTTPVPYFISDHAIPNVTVPALQAAVGRAFATWEAVPTADVTYRFAGYTTDLPGEDDGRSTIGFLNEPALDRVLATTSLLIDETTGALLESDIFFNSAFAWSTAAAGEPNRWDLETIALHEIGHFSGLGHSAIGETVLAGGGRRVLSSGSVMFPIALAIGDVSARTLDADDIAGISDLYPSADFNRSTGSVSGRITKGGRGVFGAHVVAFDPSTGDQIGNFSLTNAGEFAIAGLRPGPHVIRVEPIDDASVESFFDGSETVDVSFSPKFADVLVVVPRGGDSGAVVVPVVSK